jgi:hypothetical protein
MWRNTKRAAKNGLLMVALGVAGSAQGNAALDAAVQQALEYERDVPKAVALLQEARTAAVRKNGENHPEVTALDARIAELRAAEKRGGAPGAPGATSKPTSPARSFERRAWDLASAAANDCGWAEGQTRDVSPYFEEQAALLGTPIVPYLLRLLDGEPLLVSEGHRIVPPSVTAQLLAAINAPEADAAVAIAADSPDPVIRRAVVSALNPQRHRALIDRHLQATSPQIRGAAVGALARTGNDDQAAAEVLRAAAREGNGVAWSWLVRHRRAEAMATVTDPALGSKLRTNLAQGLGRAYPPLQAADIAALLQASRGQDTVAFDEALVNMMEAMIGGPDAKAELMKVRTTAEEWLLDRVGRSVPIGANATVRVWAQLATARSRIAASGIRRSIRPRT